MTTILKNFSLLTLIFVLAMPFSACKKDKYDKPENIYPELADGNTTIAELKALFTGGVPITITDDLDITGIVIADDRSGNLYQTIVVDDGTAAIPVLIDRNGIYTEFPIGRKINIKCKDLVLGTYAGNTQLGGIIDGISVEPIPSTLVSKYITGGTLDNDITPLIQTVENISDLNNALNYRLIKLENVEFDEPDVDNIWATQNAQGVLSDGNRNIYKCTNTSTKIIIRTSEFADFALTKTPTGNGSIIALYTVFNSTKQLVLRNTDDLDMTGVRCIPIVVYEPKSIQYLRSKFSGTSVSTDESILITGVVISSIADSNNLAQNMTIQDGTAGIVVRLSSSSPNFNKGDKIQIKVRTTDILQRFSNGSLQIGTIPNANCTKIGTENIVPQVITINELLTNFDNYESELVKVENVTISGGAGKYSGSITFTDASGSIASFVRPTSVTPSAEFVNQTYPTGNVNIVGYANLNSSTKQLILRNTNDVTTVTP
jgi:hypothetical protein